MHGCSTIPQKRVRRALMIMLLWTTFAVAVQADFITVTDNGKIRITGYTGVCGDLKIPAKINGLPVVSIADNAFRDNLTLTSVTIPNGVTTLGSSCFRDCKNLASETMPNSVTSMGSGVFMGCLNLTSVTLSTKLTYIHGGSFSGCAALSDVKIPGAITHIGSAAFSRTNLTTVTIPQKVLNIDHNAFSQIPTLTSAVFLGNAPDMGKDVFLDAAPQFTVYYPPHAIGFLSPKWTDNAGDIYQASTGKPLHAVPTPAVVSSPANSKDAPTGEAATTRDLKNDPFVGRWSTQGTSRWGEAQNTIFVVLPNGRITVQTPSLGHIEQGTWKYVGTPGESDRRYSLDFGGDLAVFEVKLSNEHDRVFDDHDPFSTRYHPFDSTWKRVKEQ